MKTQAVGENADKNANKHKQAHKADENKVHISGLKGGQRVKMVDTETENNTTTEVLEGTEGRTAKKAAKEKIRSKKYHESKVKIEAGKEYSIDQAIKLVKDTSYSKFDGTMELHLVVKKVGASAQVNLPHPAGKTKKIEVASDETVEKLKKGLIDFDILVATADMMPKLVPFARLLGPKGMMPNPKNGTLVADIKKANNFSASTVTVKTEKEAPLVHTVVGKNSQKDEEIKANTEAILKALGGARQIVRAFLKSSMSPSVKLALV